MLVWPAGAIAQEPQEDEIPQPAQETASNAVVRSQVLSGLGEWSLAQQYPGQARWLNLEDDRRILALFRPELTAPGHGALIVLADEGQTAGQAVLGGLRVALAERGVAVLTLGLEAAPEPVRQSRVQPRLAGVRQVENGAGEQADDSLMINVVGDDRVDELLASYRGRVRELLNAAHAQLSDNGYQAISVAGIGWSASHVTRWAEGRNDLSSVIWLAPRFSDGDLAALPEILSGERRWPILDLQPSNGAGRQAGVERSASLARQSVSGYQYQKVALASPPQAKDADRLASRISAWLAR